MKYTTIKKVLKEQVKKGARALWTFDEDKKVFTMIYKNYSNELQIYTPQQLIKHLDSIEKEHA
tara:strand:+ start:15988 stop:16176 length:189 start_codon:yes stop_codon:yes gene_type:complete